MSTGGATWDTAGTLTLDADNTFALADGSDEGFRLDLGWWKFTAPSAGLLTLIPGADFAPLVYIGTDADREEVARQSFVGDYGGTWLLTAGVEYRVVAFHFEGEILPASYQITASFQRWAVSPWLDDLQDDPDNYLIVTHGDLRLANPNPLYTGDAGSRPAWMEQVLRAGQARGGDVYRVQQSLGGEDPYDVAISCVVSHSDNGEGAIAVVWTGMCEPLSARLTPATEQGDTTTTGFSIGHNPASTGVGSSVFANTHGPSWHIWYLPVRDNLPVWGALSSFSQDPVDYGYPAGAVLEWEDEYPELLGVEVADGDPDAVATGGHSNEWVLNEELAPTWDGASSGWLHGSVGVPPSGPADPERPWLRFVYREGAEGEGDWQEIPDAGGWDGHGWTEDYEAPTENDSVIVAWPTDYTIPSDITTADYDTLQLARPALKFTLRAPRFRFVYESTTVPPRRIFGRSDGATHGAKRVLGGGNTVQSGKRVGTSGGAVL